MHQILTLIIKGDKKVCWSKIILREIKHAIDWISTLKKVFRVISDPRMNIKYVAKDKLEYLMPWFSTKSLLNFPWPHYAKNSYSWIDSHSQTAYVVWMFIDMSHNDTMFNSLYVRFPQVRCVENLVLTCNTNNDSIFLPIAKHK